MALKPTSTSPEFLRFYRLTDPLANRPLRLSVSGYSDWITLEQAWEIFRGGFYLQKPLKLGAYQGGQATDFLWSDLINVVCVSNRVVDILSSESITGWTTYPIELYGRKGELINCYYGLSITGKECSRDYERSEIILKPLPSGKQREVYKGLYFDEAQWDGNDMFIIHKHGIVMTEKVKILFQKNRVSNIRIASLLDLDLDVRRGDPARDRISDR